MPEEVTKVFVSATSRDLRSYREVTAQCLLRGNLHPVIQEHFPPDYREILEILRAKILSCDAVICLVGFAYGAAPEHPEGTQRRSYTQLEFDVARGLEKPIFLFIAAEPCKPDGEPEDDPPERDLQDEHRKALLGGDQIYELFSSHEELRLKVSEAIPSLLRLGSSGVLLPDIAHPPKAPEFFRGRIFELKQLDEALKRSAPCVVVVAGPGGQGKSTLLWKWWQDHQPGDFAAVFWRTAYRNGYLLDQFLDDALTYLIGSRFTKSDMPAVAARVARLVRALQERSTLLVIDGVERWLRGWDDGATRRAGNGLIDNRSGVAGLDDLLSATTGLSNGTHVLLTTRAIPKVLDDARRTVVPVYEEGRMELAGLDDEASVNLLSSLGVKGNDDELRSVSSQYGNHPLALTVLGGLLVQKFSGRLERLERVTALDPRERLFQLFDEMRANLPGGARSRRFMQAAALCIEDPPLRTLAVALEQDPSNDDWPRDSLIDQAVALDRWNVIDWDGEKEIVRLHALVREYFSSLVDASRAASVHHRLAGWYAGQPIAPDASTLEDIQPRLLAIEHALRAGDIVECRRLAARPVTPSYALVKFLSAWGHHTRGIRILGSLAGAARRTTRAEFLIGRAALERQIGQLDEAREDLDSAIALLSPRLGWLSKPRRLRLAGAYLNRGNVNQQASHLDEAVADYDRALVTLDKLPRGTLDRLIERARVLMNRGNARRDMGDYTPAVEDGGRAVELYRELVERGHVDSRPALAAALFNCANALAERESYEAALHDYGEAGALYVELIEHGRKEFETDLAQVRISRAATLNDARRSEEALAVVADTIAPLEQLIATGRRELEWLVALARMDRGLILLRLERWDEALHESDLAAETFGRLVQQGRRDMRGWHAHTLMNRANARYRLGDRVGSAEDRCAGMTLFRLLIEEGAPETRVIYFRKLIIAGEYLFREVRGEAVKILEEALSEARRGITERRAVEGLRIEARRTMDELGRMAGQVDRMHRSARILEELRNLGQSL